MFLNTHARRQLKALVTASLATALVATIPSQAASAADASAPGAGAPHESSRIGAGYLFIGTGRHAASLAPWSAHIGTGHVVTPASPRSSIAPPAVHWSARIGTGNASVKSVSGGRYTESTS